MAQTVGGSLKNLVTLDLEGIDRMYLNLYQPMLQTGGGAATFFKAHRGAKVASTVLMAPMSHAFVRATEKFAKKEQVDLIRFAKGERKDDILHQYLSGYKVEEGRAFHR